MGTCFSSESSLSLSPTTTTTAQVVSLAGDLHKYDLPVSVSQVLHAEAAASSSSSLNSSSIFLCNSDSLSYDDYIPALDFHHYLQPNQIYFLLPISKLQHPLSSKDMAALAVKASVAIQNVSKNDSNHRGKKARISPVLLVGVPSQSLPRQDGAPTPPSDSYSSTTSTTKSFGKPQPQPQRQAGFSRSASIRKLQRYTSRRAKLAVRSFRLRLSTIYEGSVL